MDVAVSYCGICHSDLSMLNNDWASSSYPFIPGHEVIGTVVAKGPHVSHLDIGDTVGVGWFSKSCMQCSSCMGGDHNLCSTVEQTIVGRHGGFASHVRSSAEWTIKLPEGLPVEKVGPLFCGGITVFSPLLQFGVLPTDHVAVIGVGGLGHLALQFMNKWGCEVTAISTTQAKKEEALSMGAHHFVELSDIEKKEELFSSQYDFILNTANVPLNWNALTKSLRPKGRLHSVGAVLDTFGAFTPLLISGQKSLSASPLGSPATVKKMLTFCQRHNISPIVESFPMSEANQALEHLKQGKARYRIVLTNDLG